MKNALILHGTEGHPKENWFDWLKQELEGKGYEVWVPQLPDSDKPDPKKYIKAINEGKFDFNNETTIIGHSSGAVAILSILSAMNINVKKIILVGAFKNDLGYEAVSALFKETFSWDKIRLSAKEIHIIHSDNDPYVPLDHGKFIADQLNTKLTMMKGQKHFNKSLLPKYNKFPELLELVLK